MAKALPGEIHLQTNRDTGRLHVLRADADALIADSVYRMCETAVGTHPDVQAGEGLLVINADNGTYRYRLTGRSNVSPDMWTAQRL
jgi:hypothetical protein